MAGLESIIRPEDVYIKKDSTVWFLVPTDKPFVAICVWDTQAKAWECTKHDDWSGMQSFKIPRDIPFIHYKVHAFALKPARDNFVKEGGGGDGQPGHVGHVVHRAPLLP